MVCTLQATAHHCSAACAASVWPLCREPPDPTCTVRAAAESFAAAFAAVQPCPGTVYLDQPRPRHAASLAPLAVLQLLQNPRQLLSPAPARSAFCRSLSWRWNQAVTMHPASTCCCALCNACSLSKIPCVCQPAPQQRLPGSGTGAPHQSMPLGLLSRSVRSVL